MLAAAPVGQTAPPVPTRLENLSAVDMFALADAARAQGRLDDALLFYKALAKDENPDIRAESRFRMAMMLADARRYRAAAMALRALLDEKPDAARARLELARMLAAMGDERAARRELRQVQASGLPAQVAVMVGKFDQLLRTRKTVGGSLELALAPDSNINRATSAQVLNTIIAPLTLSHDAQAQSGLGLHLAGQGYVRVEVGANLAIVPHVSGLANLYRAGQFNDISASGLIGLEWQHGRDRVTPSAGGSWRWFGGSLYAQTDTLALDWLHPLGKRAQIVVSGSASRAEYRRNDLQNGAIYDLNATLERALSARAGFSFSLSATRQTARDPGYATMAGGATVLGWREIGATSAYVSLGGRRTIGDQALFLFGEKRREWLLSARAGATFRKLAVRQIAPLLRVTYERNISSLALYDYRRVALEVGLTRAF